MQTDAPSLPIIILAEQAICEALVDERMDRVADILAKPVAPERLRASISQALRKPPRNVATATRPARHFTRNGSQAVDDIMDQSAAMTAVIDLADRAAASDIPILIEGESGVGKERIARAIHGSSKRAQGPFAAVNCGAGCVSEVVEIGFGASPSGLSFAAVRPRGQGFRRRLADRGFPIHRLCASGFGRKRGAPRGASALFRDTAARSVF